MKQYSVRVEIKEVYYIDVVVEAENEIQAKNKVDDMYNNEEIETGDEIANIEIDYEINGSSKDGN
jgi:hypothetical protein